MELYHILNRGVEKRKIFMNEKDYLRFIHDMYEFNDTIPAPKFSYSELRSPNMKLGRKERDMIVNIHAWCLMGNHYHMLISERMEGGLTLFLRKLNIGYAMYFNEKYKRNGTLFQGRTKKIRIASDAHFLHILHYIHLNPLDFHEGSELWRSFKIKNESSAIKYLTEYRWSSYLDYCNKKNFPSIVNMDLFSEVFGNYQRVISEYLKDLSISEIKPLLLE